ncbi:MAG: c-type cytochrome biogenesis protein CcsB [bacterium]|nr:c-type cytochrome biogenesis protein CcsB [bacterium]
MPGKINHTNLIIVSLYTLLIVCMGIATIMERLYGKPWAHDYIYGSWWFIGLWVAITLVSIASLVSHKVYRKLSVALLHLSLVVILIGAFVTHLTSEEGSVHLRKGVVTSSYTSNDGSQRPFPFTLSLREFDVVCYPATDAVMDYEALIAVSDADGMRDMLVSMNNIGRVAGYRLYQSSYDDGGGTVLLVSSDPYGIAITYTGYLMLLAGLIWTMLSRRTRVRSLMRAAMRPALPLLLILSFAPQAEAAEIDRGIADEMGQIAVLYNGRICPLNTAATDFVTKLCGRSTWEGHTANEIFVGWTIFYTEWENKKIIKVGNKDVQNVLGIDGEWACLRDFYTPQHEYKLSGKQNDMTLSESLRKAIRATDEKIQVITMFYNSEMLRIFPLAHDGRIEWHKPGSTELPHGVGEAEFQFVNHAMDYLVRSILAGDVKASKRLIAKIRLYQREKAGDALPSAALMRAETFYNSLTPTLRYAPFFLLLSLLFCYLHFATTPRRWLRLSHTALIVAMTVLISGLIGLRWIVGQHIPVSNGYETMLFMAWVSMAVTVVVSHRQPVMKALGPVVASFCMLVAMMAGGTPQVTPLMPVLQSPLLAIHVTLVMMAYALLAFLTLLSLCCLLMRRREDEEDTVLVDTRGRDSLLMRGGEDEEKTAHIDTRGRDSLLMRRREDEVSRLTALSRLLLYPAVSLLAIGIFVGAVWANVSWGAYWSWDPKETWALITLLIYALPLHREVLGASALARPRGYNLYVLAAFLAVLMTYFGVNYFLSGMHSYA